MVLRVTVEDDVHAMSLQDLRDGPRFVARIYVNDMRRLDRRHNGAAP
jgi:hypothetical protein